MSRWVALMAIVLTAAACGSPETGTTPSPSPSPVGTAKASGTMTVTTQGGSLTVELKITGLQAGSIHVSHIHIGTCAGHGAILRALNPVIADSQGDADTKSTVN